MPAKVETTPALPSLSPVGGKPVIARFDGGHLSSDGGLLVLREVEQRLDVAGRLAACIVDPRDPDRVVHGLDEIIRFRLLMIAAGYEDGNDADRLRTDPMFKLAMERLEDEAPLCSQPTVSRLENLPGTRALLRMGRAVVDLYCASFRQVPRRIVLDVDDTFDAVHGGQQLRLFNAHHDEYGFQPIVVFDGEGRFVTAVLRPAKRPSGREIRAFLRRLVRQIRSNWPRVEILLRADSHYCAPEVLRWCRANGIDYLLGVAPTSTLRRHVERLEASTAARFAASGACAKLRRFTEFYDGRGKLGPGRAHRRPRRGGAGWDGHALRRHQPAGRLGPCPLRAALLPEGPGGKPHQGLENPPRGRPHLVHKGRRQPVPPVPARRRLLAAVEPAHADAAPLVLAHRPVRHLAAAPGQARRARRRDEDPGQASPAQPRTVPVHPGFRPRPHAASDQLKGGAACPAVTRFRQPPTPPYQAVPKPPSRWPRTRTSLQLSREKRPLQPGAASSS